MKVRITRLWHRWHIARNQRRKDLLQGLGVLAIIALAYTLLTLFAPDWFAPLERWWNALGVMFTLVSAYYVCRVWIEEGEDEWEEALEKRLYVVFYLNGHPVLRCDHAPLFGESDIRTFSQQIGAQMIGARLLNFSPNILRFAPTIEQRDSPEAFKRYVAYFRLDRQRPVQWDDENRDRAQKEKGDHLIALAASPEKKTRYWPRAQRPGSGEPEEISLPVSVGEASLPEAPDAWLEASGSGRDGGDARYTTNA